VGNLRKQDAIFIMNSNRTKNAINSLDLTYRSRPASFVFRALSEVESERPPEDDDRHPHRHNYYTVIWVIRGSGSHDIDFHHYEVRPGTIFFVSPEQVHDIRIGPNPSGYVMMFTQRFLEESGIGPELTRQSGLFFQCEHVEPLVVPDGRESEELEHLMEHIRDEFQSEAAFHAEAISAWLKLFLLRCRRILDTHPREKPRASTARQQLMRHFRDLLDTHFRHWHKVSDYAQELHITPNYLNEVVSLETGNSAKDYITDRIMLEARRYATQVHISAKEISYELGFEDPAHFSKLFKQQHGDSFSGFRESYRKKYN
jgi:AraC family transcriptional regulator, transcriptional activator of pobA